MTTSRLLAITLGLAVAPGRPRRRLYRHQHRHRPWPDPGARRKYSRASAARAATCRRNCRGTAAPAGTKSYAVTLYDPDAPTGSGWWHWSVFNVPASTTSLPGGATASTLPAGAMQGRNDYGDSAYGGACPPPGDKAHRYQITVWALSVDKLPLDQQASGAMLGYMLNANALGKAQLTGLYGR